MVANELQLLCNENHIGEVRLYITTPNVYERNQN